MKSNVSITCILIFLVYISSKNAASKSPLSFFNLSPHLHPHGQVRPHQRDAICQKRTAHDYSPVLHPKPPTLAPCPHPRIHLAIPLDIIHSSKTIHQRAFVFCPGEGGGGRFGAERSVFCNRIDFTVFLIDGKGWCVGLEKRGAEWGLCTMGV